MFQDISNVLITVAAWKVSVYAGHLISHKSVDESRRPKGNDGADTGESYGEAIITHRG